jgi:hypothetical protein
VSLFSGVALSRDEVALFSLMGGRGDIFGVGAVRSFIMSTVVWRTIWREEVEAVDSRVKGRISGIGIITYGRSFRPYVFTSIHLYPQ